MASDSVTLNHMRHFVAAVEAGSFVSAGDRLHIAPTSISHAVSVIEQTLGRQLLVRKRASGVVPTPVGHRFLVSCRRILQDVDAVYEQYSSAPSDLTGELIVGCQEGLTWSVAPRAVEVLKQAHPNLKVSVKTIFMEQELAPLDSGEVDLMLTFRHAYSQPNLAKKIDNNDVYSKVLCSPQAYAMVHGDHPLCKTSETQVYLKDLAPYPHIFINDGPALPLFLGMYEQMGLRPNVAMVSNVSPAAQSVVGVTDAVSVRIVRPSINLSPLGDKLAYLRVLDDVPCPDLIAVAHMSLQSGISNPAKAFIDACQAKFDDGALKDNFFY